MRLFGSITALATPFTADGAVDFPAWLRLLEKQRAGGTSAVVVAGSTGEASMLEDAEYERLIEEAVRSVGSTMAVWAGTGLSGTAKTLAQTRRAAACGAHAALVVTPPYVRPTQEGMVAHYMTIADADVLPVVLYNVPPRTGVDLLPETMVPLAAHPRIVGVKEARSDDERWQALASLASETFDLLSGDDPTFVSALRYGARGVVSVASNLIPATMARIVDDAGSGHWDAAMARHRGLAELLEFLGSAPNPIPLKALLAAVGLGSGLRLPLLPLDAPHAARLPAMLDLALRVDADALNDRRAA